MVKSKDSVLEFMRRQREFAVAHGIDPDNWQRDYLAKPKAERDKIQSEWSQFLRAFDRETAARWKKK